MTVIAWDGHTLAADRMMDMHGGKFPVSKLRRLEDGSLMGGAGDIPRIYEMQRWIEDGSKAGALAPAVGEMYARVLLVKPDGTAFTYANNEFPIHILREFTAIGSGQDYAIAAMFMGADARMAVSVASELCASCGMGIDTLEL
jgi:hypothetical protein